MMVLLTYDVSMADASGPRRLRRLAKVCLDHGVRVQFSVFECDIGYEQWPSFKAKVLEIIDSDVDSVRFYKLGKNWRKQVEHYGAKPSLDIFKDTLIL
ncbi:CRISPR-associated endonuclease Cas2 [Ferrimonas kyonanensis]|uniref:CRISPR-associated endonuclease Cas2 n=1 Tax=Ferrimonas kyonanensis TaxID=364763 RepID=UPI0004821145|nr:CRISPR-associated endonuclease Cas2 [Ferrimonas kyonanensis]